MERLFVFLEISGQKRLVGSLEYSSNSAAQFSYDEKFLEDENARPISVSLPLQKEAFSFEQTKNFFDGLLPEGFVRRTIAETLRFADDEYVSVLKVLGRECLGAIAIRDEKTFDEDGGYKRLNEKEILDLARDGVIKSTEILEKTHLSLTGASGKVGLYYNEFTEEWFLPLGGFASNYIVKQSHVRLNDIVVNELLSMTTAKKLGVNTAECKIINSPDASAVLFASKRFDRTEVNGSVARLHQEDFAQALGISSACKYEKPGENYLKKIFGLISDQSGNPIGDLKMLWRTVVFNYFLGNTDAHIKNFSLLYTGDLSSKSLAPAYDLISTVIYPSSTKNMALSINGKFDITEIGREDFRLAAKTAGLGYNFAMEIFDEIAGSFDSALQESAEEIADLGYPIALNFLRLRTAAAVKW